MSTPNVDPYTIEVTSKAGCQPVRLSYPHLFVAKKFSVSDPNSKPKYSATLIFDKKIHAALIAKIKATIALVAKNEFKGVVPPADRVCLKDGAERVNQDTGEPEIGYGPDVMYISASTDTRPGVVDQNLVPLSEQDGKPAGGDYVYARFRLWALGGVTSNAPKEWGRRICAGLITVQFAKEGVRFGRPAESADNGFAPVADENPVG